MGATLDCLTCALASLCRIGHKCNSVEEWFWKSPRLYGPATVNASVFSVFPLIGTAADGYDARSAFSVRRRPAHAPTE